MRTTGDTAVERRSRQQRTAITDCGGRGEQCVFPEAAAFQETEILITKAKKNNEAGSGVRG
jgi:hypothetical protein